MSLTISLTPDEVEHLLNKVGIACRFSETERARLTTTDVVASSDTVFAFPTPLDNAALTVINLRNAFGTDPTHQPSFFDHPWYLNEPFTRVPAEPGWHFLTTDVLPDSVSQPHTYIRSLTHPQFVLPTAVEVILMLFLNYMKTGEQLLLKKHTWCADSAGLDERVTVGAFGRNGVFVSKHPANYASRGLGICPKILH